MANLMDNPCELAQGIARLLDSDPVAVRQVKEHLPPARILELLEIELSVKNMEDDEAHVLLDEFDEDVILDWVADHCTKAKVLAAFARA